MAQERVTCPWCENNFDIDPALAAFAYRCPSCNRQALLQGLRSSRRGPNTIDLHNAASIAIANHLFPFTIAIRYRADCEEQIATGTLCKVGPRLLIMTAGHVITAKTESNVRFVSKAPNPEPPVGLRISKVGKREFSDVDVGFIELMEASDVDRLHAEALPLNRIKDFRCGDPDRTTRIYGYPAAVIKPSGTDAVKLYNVCLGSTVVEPEHWVSIRREVRNPDPEKDVVLRFDRSDEFWSYGPEEARSDKPPDPNGMSGGGCWHGEMPPDSMQVWSAEEVSLFGIQSQWPRKGRFLRAVLVIHWLKLVAESYPELIDELHSSYPRLATLT